MPSALLIGAPAPQTTQTAPTPQTPIFRSAVDLVAVDVQVVSRDGEPIDGLGIDNFDVTFDGHLRRLVSVDFLRKKPLPSAADGGPERPIYTPGVVPPDTRIFILAIDTSTFASNTIKPAVQAAQRFLANLHADDMVALYTYPFDTPALALTHDHRAVGRALDRILGQQDTFVSSFHLSASEVIDITGNDSETFRRVVARECAVDDPTCGPSIQMEAAQQASYFEGQTQQGMGALRVMMRGLETLPGRKTVVLLSGGLVAGDRVGGRPDITALMDTVGAEAGASDASLYVLHLDNSFFNTFSAGNGPVRDASDRFQSWGRDESVLGRGLERLAASAGGALLRVQAGTADRAFNRILTESSAYYLLGVQPLPTDRDGKLHFLRIKVKKRGATVRSRTHVVIPKK